jgi:PilZ domain-containing protein
MQYQKPRPQPPTPPAPPVIPPRERRRHERMALDNVRVRVSNAQFDDVGGGVNFAKRLINVSMGGVCIETSGRLRPDVKLFVEVKFEAFVGAIRTQAQVIWANTVARGGVETHLMGLKFIQPEISSTVRDFFEGDRATLIMTRKQAEYEVLKSNSEKRKLEAVRKPWSKPKKTVAGILVLLFVYIAAFGGLVTAGRRESTSPGIHFRYLGPQSTGEGSGEQTLAKIFSPLVWTLRKAGVDLTYDNPVTSK